MEIPYSSKLLTRFFYIYLNIDYTNIIFKDMLDINQIIMIHDFYIENYIIF